MIPSKAPEMLKYPQKADLQIKRYAVYYRCSPSQILQFAYTPRLCHSSNQRHAFCQSVRPSLLRMLSETCCVEPHLVEYSLREFVNVSVCDIPDIRHECRTANRIELESGAGSTGGQALTSQLAYSYKVYRLDQNHPSPAEHQTNIPKA